MPNINSHLSMKQGSLFCHIALHVVLLVPFKKALNWVGCIDLVWDCLELWCESYWLLNFFLNEFFLKIEIKIFVGIWGHPRCRWKALSESDLIDFISQFSELTNGRYWFFSGFYCWKFKQITKNWVWKQKSVEPSLLN